MSAYPKSYSLSPGRVNIMRKLRSRSRRSLNISASFEFLDAGMKNGKHLTGPALANKHSAFFEPRIAVLQRGKKGFGFVLRGAKSAKTPSIDFVPTKEFPALQYLESVDKGSPADKAGLLRGDFVLEINGEDVTTAPHQQVVHMVVTAPDTIVVKVVTAPNLRGQETLQRLASKHPKKLSRLQQRKGSSYESDTWSVCSSLDDSDSFIRPEVEIISIGTPTISAKSSASGGLSYPDDPSKWQSTLPSNGIGRSKNHRPLAPPPAPNKFNTIARVNSNHGAGLRQQAIQASQDRSTGFEEDIADGLLNRDRRHSAGSDSAVSSSRSSPASSYSYTTSSSTSGTDSAVYMNHERTGSDLVVPKQPTKKPLPPPPMRSSSLPSPQTNVSEEVVSPTEEPKSGFAAAIAQAAKAKNKKAAPPPPPSAAPPPPAEAPINNTSDRTPFEIAMHAKQRTLRRMSSGEEPPPTKPKPDTVDTPSILMAAIAKRKAKMQTQNSDDIESKIKNFKKQEAHNRATDDEAAFAKALAKRRSKVDQDQVSSDESSESPQGSPKRLVKQVSLESKTKPDRKPPPPPVAAKKEPKPLAKPKPLSPVKEVHGPSTKNSTVNNENSETIVPPPLAFHSDHSLERRKGALKDNSLETASVSSSQSSLSTTSNMSTDPSSNDSSENTHEHQDIFASTNSVKSNSSASSSVVTVKSVSDPENDNDEMQPDANKQSDSPKPASQWTCEDVAEWLSSIKMSDYRNSFVENEISGEHLLALEKDDLGELGVTRLGHKMTIMKAIQKLS